MLMMSVVPTACRGARSSCASQTVEAGTPLQVVDTLQGLRPVIRLLSASRRYTPYHQAASSRRQRWLDALCLRGAR